MVSKRIGRGILISIAMFALVGAGVVVFNARADEEGKERPEHGRAWLGVTLSDEGDGVEIASVFDDSAAEKAGLKRGDVVVEIAGETVKDADDVIDAMREQEPGDEIQIKVRRDGQVVTKTATLGERKDDRVVIRRELGHDGRPMAFFLDRGGHGGSRLGVQIQPLTNGLRKYFGVPEDKGVLVSDVVEDSPAEKAGIVAGDVIVSVDGQPISGIGDLIEEISETDPGESVEIVLIRERVETKLNATVEKAESEHGFEWHHGPGDSSFDFVCPKGIVDGELQREMSELREELREIEIPLRAEIEAEVQRGVVEAKRAVQEDMRKAIEEARRGMEEARAEIEKVRIRLLEI